MSGRTAEACCIYREDDEAGRLEIWDQSGQRSLWFDDVILQSEIDLTNPGRLPNPVNRAMLAPLMFNPSMSSVLLAGCGGGAVARWLHARAPMITGDAVERSPAVARLARDYFDFPPVTSNWRLVVADVRAFLKRAERRYDFILVDLAERQATPAWVTGGPFLSDCQAHLSERGMLILNLIVESSTAAARELAAIRRVFNAGIGLLADPDHDNLLVLASGVPLPPNPGMVALQATSDRWGIEFANLAGRLVRVPPAPPPGD